MDAQTLLSKAMSGNHRTKIRARDLYDCILSPFTLWCKYFAPQEEQDGRSEYQELLMKVGREHENNVVSDMFAKAEEVSYKTPEEGFGKVIEAMIEGRDAIHNAPLIWNREGLIGVVDVLEKVKGKSLLGNYHYVIKEIKLAKNIQEHHQIQACFYNYILGKIQGVFPTTYYIINRDEEVLEYRYNEEWLKGIMDETREILTEKTIPTPTFGNGVWPWEDYTDKKAIEQNNVSLVSGIGEVTKNALMTNGYETVDDLVRANPEDLCQIDRIGESTALKIIRCAKALKSGKPIRIEKYIFPKVDIEIFLDLEGTGQVTGENIVPIDYLIGLLIRNKEKEIFKPFVANDINSEGEMFLEFLKYVRSIKKRFMMYHWHHYEHTHIKNMCLKYATEKDWKFLENHMIDLFKIATKSWAFPTYNNSLKSIAPFMGFKWRHKDVNAMESMAFYFEYTQDPKKNKEKLQKVVDYNEDDVRATMVVKDWLDKHSE